RTGVLCCLILRTALLHRQALGAVVRCRSSGLLGWGSSCRRSRGCSSGCVVTALSLAEIVPLHVAKRAGILGRLILCATFFHRQRIGRRRKSECGGTHDNGCAGHSCDGSNRHLVTPVECSSCNHPACFHALRSC